MLASTAKQRGDWHECQMFGNEKSKDVGYVYFNCLLCGIWTFFLGSLCEWWKRSYRYRYVNGRKEVTNIGDYTVAANVYQKILEIWHAYGCYQKLQ